MGPGADPSDRVYCAGLKPTILRIAEWAAGARSLQHDIEAGEQQDEAAELVQALHNVGGEGGSVETYQSLLYSVHMGTMSAIVTSQAGRLGRAC